MQRTRLRRAADLGRYSASRLRGSYKPEAPASELMVAPGIHSLALRARIKSMVSMGATQAFGALAALFWATVAVASPFPFPPPIAADVLLGNHSSRKNDGLTSKNRASRSICSRLIFLLPARMSETVDTASPAPAATSLRVI
jgi:hypothetical protein